MRVNDTDVTRITICCHINYYMIEICHDRFKVMYLNMSFFSVFRSFFKFDVKKFFSCLVNLSVVLSRVAARVIDVLLGCN